MKKINFKSLIPHLAALIAFVAISAIYFYPILQGYRLKQADIKQHKGMSQELKDHKEEFDEEPLWIGNMFGGMPAYQVSTVRYSGNVLTFFQDLIKLWFPHPIGLLIAYMIGFYILLLSLRINPWIALIGAIAFAFSSYFIVIIEAGHTSKSYAIAYMAPVLGGIISILRGRVWIGVLITTIFMGLELYANHLQITYYLILPILVVGIVELVAQLKAGQSAEFFKRAAFVILAVVLGVLPNLGNILTTYEYSKASTRSPSELTINPDGSSNENIRSTGLDKDYITRWSYGIEETFTLLLPNAKGGKSGAILGKEDDVKRLQKEDPQFFNFMVSQYQNERFIVNTYWGNQPFTSGPVYAGAIVCFLAFLAFFFVKDRLVIGLGVAAFLAMLLAWGKNFNGLTDFFIDYVPMYNKFRAVSMILVIVELILPLLGILFVAKLFQDREKLLAQKKKFLIAGGGFIAVLLLFWMTPETFFDFLSSDEKAHLSEQLKQNPQASNQLYSGFDSIVDYRVEVFQADVVRSLQYILLAFALLYFFLIGKLNQKLFLLGLGALIFVDLWSLDKDYLNNKEKEGVSSTASNRYEAYQKPVTSQIPYTANPVDKTILNRELKAHPEIAQAIQEEVQALKQENPRPSPARIEKIQFTELMRGTHYRVLNTNKKLDEDAQTAFFHKTLGGYHGAKMKKYQELIDFELGIEFFQLRQAFQQGGEDLVRQLLPQMNTTNMLNAKYVMGAMRTQEGNRLALVENPYRLGNAWFVEDYKMVADANEEIKSIEKLDPEKTALIRADEEIELAPNYQTSPSDFINLKSYLPNKLVYQYSAASKRLAVFSEIYYEKGWNAYLNGEKVPHFKVNYILRGMELPAGEGELIFKFEPSSYEVGQYATWASSLILILMLVGVGFRELKTPKAD
ncbi:MAG: hypothetical protein RIC95_00205 [Vicingaceae bacterium]